MTETVLRAEEHFEALRDAVWARFRARHAVFSRDRFEDAYAEWWTRELERAAAGRPSRAGAPVAFVTEAVHRVLLDEGRARARGLGRDEKKTLELVDLDGRLDLAHADDTAATAHYEAVAHRVLGLVRDRLTPRELSVFVWTFLYLQSTPATAAALGLSEPRVKKDRKRIATRVGEEVWAVLTGELSLCAAYGEKQLQAVFEQLADHLEECPECAVALGGLRRGAVAVVAPVEALAVGAGSGVGSLGELWDALLTRLAAPARRAGELALSMPPGGRVAAVAAAVAVTAGGGSVAARPASEPVTPAAAPVEATPAATPSATPAATPVVAAAPPVEPTATPAPTAARGRRDRFRRSRRTAAPSPTRSPAGRPRRARSSATFPPARAAPAPAASPPPAAGEFGFEHP